MGLANRQSPTGAADAARLRDLYVTQGLAIGTVASQIGSTIWVTQRLLGEYGIRIRPRDQRAFAMWDHAPLSRREEARATAEAHLVTWTKAHPELSYAYALRAGIASQRARKPSSLETRMMHALDRAGISYQFQFVVGGKFACDFAMIDYSLIVEVDGVYWHSRPEAQRRDYSKTTYLTKCGYTVLRFTDVQLRHDSHACIEAIRAHLQVPKALPISSVKSATKGPVSASSAS